jgi:hypothetical protein
MSSEKQHHQQPASPPKESKPEPSRQDVVKQSAEPKVDLAGISPPLQSLSDQTSEKSKSPLESDLEHGDTIYIDQEGNMHVNNQKTR